MINFIVIAILLLIIGGISFYIYKQKKQGAKCIGCPYAKQCSGHCGAGCNVTNEKKSDEKKNDQQEV